MRLKALVLVALVAGVVPAAAQNWQEYTYPRDSFGVSFPETPKVETTTYEAADGRMVEAHIYSASEPNAIYRMTVADLSDSNMEENAVIDHAIKALSQDGEVKLDIPHRISAVYGRQLSISGRDGSHNSVAVFFYKKRLYQIEGKALPGGEDGTANAIRFQQSLIFTENQSNRSLTGRVFEVVGRLF